MLIYLRTENLRAVQLLLGRSRIDRTVRDLGIDVDDAIEIAEKIGISTFDAIPLSADIVSGALSAADLHRPNVGFVGDATLCAAARGARHESARGPKPR